MSDIKSFREIAMEKIAAIGEASEEEQLKWKYQPVGEKLAASCLIDGTDIKSKIAGYDKKVMNYILKGAEKTFLANIDLPKNEAVKKTNDKAIENLLFIKNDKTAAEEVFNNIAYIFEHYNVQGKQQKEQSYELLKSDFKNKVEQALEQKAGGAQNIDINVESLPQFQEEWRKVQSQIDGQYSSYLADYKQTLRNIE